jgi:ribonuclease Z
LREQHKDNAHYLFYKQKHIEIAYSGDTTIEGVLNNDKLLNAKVLLLECTILDDSVSEEQCHTRGHIHIQDLVTHWRYFRNEAIVLFHFSPRYSEMNVEAMVRKALKTGGVPESFINKVQVLFTNINT